VVGLVVGPKYFERRIHATLVRDLPLLPSPAAPRPAASNKSNAALEYAIAQPEVRVSLTEGPEVDHIIRTSREQTPGLVIGRTRHQLPWNVTVAYLEPDTYHDYFSMALQRFFAPLKLLGIWLALVCGAIYLYLVTRAVRRELSAGRLQANFLTIVSHEFRTPLTSMRQLSELLALGRVPGEDKKQQFYEVLLRETNRLQSLVEQLLDFKGMEEGASSYNLEPQDALALVRTTVEQFQDAMEGRSYHVQLHIDEPSAIVRADTEALARAIRNLLDNAVKYSPHCPTIWVDLSREGKHLAIRVRDRGVGIPASEKKHIFEKFVRGSSSKQTGAKGSGIGLTMVDHIVRAHKGKLLLESTVGVGSTFTMVLPIWEK
jgi:signal transduction histidine kinase